jgi:hypothetical protein
MMASVDMMVIPPPAGLVVGKIWYFRSLAGWAVGKIWYFRDHAGVGCWYKLGFPRPAGLVVGKIWYFRDHAGWAVGKGWDFRGRCMFRKDGVGRHCARRG